MTHLAPEQLESLLLDEPPPPDDRRLRHLAACPECARRLAREARVEAMHDAVAANDRPSLRVPSASRRAVPWRYVLAAAAALAVVFAAARLLSPPATPESGSEASALTIPLLLDTPCLVDPLALGPGLDVLAPSEVCRGVTSPNLSRKPTLTL